MTRKFSLWLVLATAGAILSVAGCKAPDSSSPFKSDAATLTASADTAAPGVPDVLSDNGACVTSNPLDQEISDDNHNMACVGTMDTVGVNFPSAPAPGAAKGNVRKGHDLFFNQSFGTNGRTCGTCHAPDTGTISPDRVEARFAADPGEPLFRAIDSDDDKGGSYDLLRNRATIRVHIKPIASNICVLNEAAPDPSGFLAMAEGGGIPADLTAAAKAALCSPSREVVVNRGVPSMFNTPALDPLLMLDGRERILPGEDPSRDVVKTQAGDAVRSHFFAAGETPTIAGLDDDLHEIADFERTLFTSDALEKLARSDKAPAPELPMASSPDPVIHASEERGREFFVPQAFDPNNPKRGMCAQCHAGPMLNTVQGFMRLTVAGAGIPKNALGIIQYPGDRFTNVLISQLNGATTRDRADEGLPGRLAAKPLAPPGRFNPTNVYLITQPDGTTIALSSADPGKGLLTGKLDDWNNFRIPTLWGVSKTAPYFHDNSAQRLEDVVHHYAQFFAVIEFAQQNIVITPQDEEDLVNYLKLL